MSSLILASLLSAYLPPEAPQVEALSFDVSVLKKLDRIELRIMERGKPVVYAGVPLAVPLKAKLGDMTSMAALRSVSDAVLLVRARDGYQAAVSAIAVAMDGKGERYLLAFERDGQPLDEREGPVKLVIPTDPQHIRWVRMVSAIDLVRLKDLNPSKQRDRGNSPAPSRS
jgi:hypothetical protein